MDAATHPIRVPFQRRHASTGRHVPHLERLVARRRNDAPPVRKHGNAEDLRRSQIITKVQWTPQRANFECPFSVARHSPVATSHTLSVLSFEPDTTRRPSGNIATLVTYDEDTSSQSTVDAATHDRRVPFQRRHACAGRHVPYLERVVFRRRHNAPPVRRYGNAIDLRRSQISTKVQQTPRAAPNSSALAASPRICPSPRPTP